GLGIGALEGGTGEGARARRRGRGGGRGTRRRGGGRARLDGPELRVEARRVGEVGTPDPIGVEDAHVAAPVAHDDLGAVGRPLRVVVAVDTVGETGRHGVAGRGRDEGGGGAVDIVRDRDLGAV